MKKIKVRLENRSYDIITGAGAVKRLPAVCSRIKPGGPYVIVTDSKLYPKIEKRVGPLLKKLKGPVYIITIPSGEKAKSIEVFKDTVQKVSRKTRGYRPLIVAIGGGVVGDLSGFIAATYRRGVPFVNVPTTLLSQVDSSVGGKTGIDLPEAKNLVGAFHQPEAVLVDVDLLKTLPVKQIRNGLAETIKYGMIKDPGLFVMLEKGVVDILRLKKKLLEETVYKCLRIKAEVVAADEFDREDVRIILNFGHTLGHAIETASSYTGVYDHGGSVALGMLLAGEIARSMGMFSSKEFERLRGLIEKAGLPLKFKGIDVKDVFKAHSFDKKFLRGKNRFVLPRKIGKVEVVEGVSEALIKRILDEYAG